jgi:hypothetical protein
MEKKNPDPGSGIEKFGAGIHLRKLVSVFGLKVPQLFYADPDPGSWILKTLDPGSGMEKFGSEC